MPKSVNIPCELYNKITKKIEELGFKTVDEYVEFVLRNILEEEEPKSDFSKEEEELIKKRLRDLGYLD